MLPLPPHLRDRPVFPVPPPPPSGANCPIPSRLPQHVLRILPPAPQHGLQPPAPVRPHGPQPPPPVRPHGPQPPPPVRPHGPQPPPPVMDPAVQPVTPVFDRGFALPGARVCGRHPEAYPWDPSRACGGFIAPDCGSFIGPDCTTDTTVAVGTDRSRPARSGGSDSSAYSASPSPPPISGGSGGARDALRRAPPILALVSEERIQGLLLQTSPGVSPCRIKLQPIDHFSPGSSPARSDASEGAAADTQPKPGRSTQMLLAMSAMGGRGGPYGRRPASYGSCAGWSSCSLNAHRPASPSNICSRDHRDTSSFVRSQQEQEQGRLPTREDFLKCFATPQNIQLQTPRHPSLPNKRVNGSNRGPPKFIHKAAPARLMRRARSSHNYHGKCMGAIDPVNEWRLPKVSEEEDEAVDQKDWQDDTQSSRVSSALDWNFESNSAYEGSNHNDGRAFDHSEVKDCAAAVQRMEKWLRGPAMKHIEKLIDKLNQKEAHLAHWKTLMARARNATINTEKKLEKKRSEAAKKTQIKLKMSTFLGNAKMAGRC